MSEDKTNDRAKSASSNPASSTAAAKPTSSRSAGPANKPAGSSQPGTAATPAPASADASKAKASAQSPASRSTPPKPAGGAGASSNSKSTSKSTSASSASAGAGSRPGQGSPQSSGAASNKPSSQPSTASASGANRGASNGGGSGGAKPGKDKSGSGGGAALSVAVIAIIIALLAAAGAGWLWYRGQAQTADLSSRVNTVEQGMQSNVQQVVMPRLSDMDNKVSSLSSDVSGLSSQMDERQQQVNQLQEQIRNVQTQNSQLVDRLDGTHQRYIAQRVQALLEAANQRLTIYNDPKGAAQALKLADTAIQQAGDPRLFPVRRDIANGEAAIKALPNPDIEGLSLKLSNLVAQVPNLPLSTNVPGEYRDTRSGDQSHGNSSDDDGGLSSIDVSRGWQHFTRSLGHALSSMVTIRRANGTQNAPALMAPDQAYFLTQNLQLQLRSAELALMNRNGDAYRDNLSSARDWIKQYFNGDEASVQAALDTLNELSNVQLDWQAPDISAGMQTLQDIMSDEAGSAANGEPASDEVTSEQDSNATDGGSEQ